MVKLALLSSVFAVSFSQQITLGSAMVMLVVGIATVTNILGGGRRWKDNYEAEAEKNKLLYERCHEYAIAKNEAERRLHQVEIECAALKERPNFDEMMQLLKLQDQKATERNVGALDTMLAKIDERFDAAERRHEARHAETAKTLSRAVEALEALAQRRAA